MTGLAGLAADFAAGVGVENVFVGGLVVDAFDDVDFALDLPGEWGVSRGSRLGRGVDDVRAKAPARETRRLATYRTWLAWS